MRLIGGYNPVVFSCRCPCHSHDIRLSTMTTGQPAATAGRTYFTGAGGNARQFNGDINIWPLASQYHLDYQSLRRYINQPLLTYHVFVVAPETRPGPLVPKTKIFRVPPKPEFFQGRDDCLAKICRRLLVDKRQPFPELRSCLIAAMGGMGKTWIALEYAHRNRKHYDCIFWLGAQQSPKLSFGFASIAIELGIPQAETMGGSRRYELVKEWLETTGKTPKTRHSGYSC